MQPDMKSLAFDLKAVDGGDPNGEFEAILSTPGVDREGETVAAGALNPLPKSIPVHFAHDFIAGAAPIGVAEPYYDGDTLKVRGRFAPTERAQEMRALVNGGFVTAMSAGFIATKRKGKSIIQGDLIEGSLTATPVNTQALILASKSLERPTVMEALVAKAGARNNRTDASRLQQIHDYAVENGAACTPSSKSLKAVDGSWEQRQEELYETLRAAHPDADYVEILATFDNNIVYEIHGGVYDDAQFRRSYTFDGNEVVLAAPEEVEAVENLVITPAGAEPPAGKSVSDPSAAAASAAAADDLERERQRVRVWQMTA